MSDTTRKRAKPETVVLTREQVRELLTEGRLVRAELEQRVEKMHRLTLEERLSQAR